MASIECYVKCAQCGCCAHSESWGYRDEISCSYCGYEHSVRFTMRSKESLEKDWYYDVQLSEGYVSDQFTNMNNDLVNVISKETAGLGIIVYVDSTGTHLYTLTTPVSQEIETKVLEDATVTFASKWDVENKCLVIIKGTARKWTDEDMENPY